jgi:LuxR family maltose regulon positive regulatory protein
MTLVSAPAGYGKTTLITDWLQRAARPASWLALDENDNDQARFTAYLIAALQGIDPRIGKTAEAMLLTPQPPPPESILTTLINDIAATARPFVLVLDDYHSINMLPIHQLLTFLLDHQPPQMHLVIATREDPPLPVSRWRARGQLVEIRQADLRFTTQQTADFLRRVMRLDLSPPEVTALHQRTEGWIAGLQLTALSMQGRDDKHQLVQSLTGCQRHILDYLIDEVFQHQTPDLQDFLLKTSVLDRFSAPLCDAVTERADGQKTLLALEQANLFLIPLDELRQWYRYHRLFADLLRHRLETVETEAAVNHLHQVASQWYEAHGFPADAIHHALRASDSGRAATLIGQTASSLLRRGEIATLLRWFQALPDEVVRASPQLCVAYSWPLSFTGQLDAAESYLAHAEQTTGGETRLLGEVATARVQIARARGDDYRTVELSRQALSLLAQDQSEARSVVAVNLGVALWNIGDLAQAEQALGEAILAAERSGNTFAQAMALVFLGRVQASRGRLHQAAELYRRVTRPGEPRAPFFPLAFAHPDLSALLYEQDDLENAANHLEQGMDMARRSGEAETQIYGYRMLAFLEQAQGREQAALEALQEADRLTAGSNVPPLVPSRNAACHAQIALMQGDLAAATRWAGLVEEDADACAFHRALNLTPPRLLVAQGQRAAAAEQLDGLYHAAAEAGLGWGMLRVRVLQGLAAPTPDAALPFLAEALQLGEREGFVRSFVDEGSSLVPLLRQAATQGIAPLYVKRLLAAFEVDTARRRGEKLPAALQPLIEALSERELEVLQLAAEGLTNQEIAQRLHISLNTVKTHLSNVYGKLGVTDRRHAAAKARTLSLIE